MQCANQTQVVASIAETRHFVLTGHWHLVGGTSFVTHVSSDIPFVSSLNHVLWFS